jgi:Protein kinase domain
VSSGTSQLEPGAAIGGYRIEGVAGRGGMGVVYRARQLRPDRVVALKVINPELARDPTFRARFELEANIAASIEHPNVLPIYEFGEEGGVLYLTMRWVEGTDMRQVLIREGALEPARAARIVEQVADALDAAHASGLVHRDVKPGNILLVERGGREHAFLTDFGLTKRTSGDAAGETLTQAGSWVGTLDYVAPEQIQGQAIDARADVYSLGCVLFQALSGRVPFERDSDVSKIYAHISEPPPDLAHVVAGVSPTLAGVVMKAMAKKPEDRFASAGDFGRAAVAAAQQQALPDLQGSVAVGQAAGDTPTVAQPLPPAAATTAAAATAAAATATPAYAPPGRKRPPIALLAGGALALVAIAVVLVVVLSSSSSSSRRADPRKEVETAAANFMAASGASTCDLVSPAFIARNYKGLADCRKSFATANSESISGPQTVSVTGSRATDSFDLASGHHYSLVLVKENGKWVIDDSSDDTQDAQNAAHDYVTAKGAEVCKLVTPSLRSAKFGGANCESTESSYKPVKASGDQVKATSARATDDLSIGGKQGTLTLVKVSGSWLVESDTTLK